MRALAAILLALLVVSCGPGPAPESPATPAPPPPPPPTAPPPTYQPRPPAAPIPPPTPAPVVYPRPTPPPPPQQETRSARVVRRPTPTATPVVARFPYAVTDSYGRAITFEAPPERIVAYDAAAVETLFAIGQGDRVVATHSYVFYPPEVADIPKVGDAFTIDIEAVVNLEPDLVFIFFDRFVEDLERAGLKVLYLQSLQDDFTQVADRIRMWGRITGAVQEAEEVAQSFEERVRRIEQALEPYETGPSVFQDVGGLWTPGPDTLVGQVFRLLKLRNIAYDVQGYAQLSPEVVVERNPDIIIAVDPQAYLEDPVFKDVIAVKNGNVFALPSDKLSVASPRFVEGIEELAALVYPALFGAPATAGVGR